MPPISPHKVKQPPAPSPQQRVLEAAAQALKFRVGNSYCCRTDRRAWQGSLQTRDTDGHFKFADLGRWETLQGEPAISRGVLALSG